jgi:hypothetical protein
VLSGRRGSVRLERDSDSDTEPDSDDYGSDMS